MNQVDLEGKLKKKTALEFLRDKEVDGEPAPGIGGNPSL